MFEKGHVRRNCIPHFLVFDIRYSKLTAGLLDNAADLRVVYVRDLGKQVVLDLEVEAAYKPADPFAVRRKISRCLQLVNCPLVVNFTGLRIRYRKMRVFHGVRQLEYNGNDQPGHHGKDGRTIKVMEAKPKEDRPARSGGGFGGGGGNRGGGYGGGNSGGGYNKNRY